MLAVRGWARVPDHIRYGGVSSWLHSSVAIAVLHAVSGGLCMPARGPAGGSGSLYAGDVLSGGAGCLHGVSGGLRLPGDGPRLAAALPVGTDVVSRADQLLCVPRGLRMRWQLDACLPTRHLFAPRGRR